MRQEALNLLANGKKEDATTWELIAKAALEDKESSVRQHVLGLLATHRFDFRTKIILTRDLDGQYPYIDPSRPITKNWIALCATKLGTTTGEVRSMFEKLTDVLPLKFEI